MRRAADDGPRQRRQNAAEQQNNQQRSNEKISRISTQRKRRPAHGSTAHGGPKHANSPRPKGPRPLLAAQRHTAATTVEQLTTEESEKHATDQRNSPQKPNPTERPQAAAAPRAGESTSVMAERPKRGYSKTGGPRKRVCREGVQRAACRCHPRVARCSRIPSALWARWFNESLSSLLQSPSFPCSGDGFTPPPTPSLGSGRGAPRGVRRSFLAQDGSKRASESPRCSPRWPRIRQDLPR